MLPDWAVMLVVSVLLTVSAVARPELSIVATAVFEDVHVTELVKSVVVPFWRIPIAVNCCVAPEEIDGLVGVIDMDARFAVTTLTVVEPLIPFKVALMVADPEATPVTSPAELTVAIVTPEVDQLAELVIVSVLPSLYVPVADICWAFLTAIDGVEGPILTVLKVGPVKKFLQPITVTLTEQIKAQKTMAAPFRFE
jgi:hypothetical protein